MRPWRMRTLVLLSTIGTAFVAVRATRAQDPPQKPAVIGHQITAVPKLRGRPLKDTLLLSKARLILGRLDSMPDTAASGTILRQSLEPGSPVAVGTPVDLTFAIPIRTAILPFIPATAKNQGPTVPRLVGRSLPDARLLLRASGLVLGDTTGVANAAAPGTVLTQSPAEGQPVGAATGVSVTYAVPIQHIVDDVPKAPTVDSATVPDVRTGLSVVEATIILGIAGLDVGATHALTDDEHAGKVVRQAPEAGMRVPKHSQVELWYANEVRVAIPDVVGRRVDEAKTAIESARLKLGKVDDPEHTSGRGLVARQRPRAGADVNIGTTVQLRLGPLPEVTVPPLVGLPLEDANGELTHAGLSLGSVDSTPSDGTPGTVLTQNPEAGAKVPESSRVSLGIATPRPDTVVPDVRGRTLAEATASIVGAGLQVAQRVESVRVERDTGLVSAQQPAAGTRVRPGAEVALTVTVASPPPPPLPTTIAMPLVTGWLEAKAIGQVRSVGLTRIALSRRKSPGKAGLVLEQSPAAGTQVGPTAPVKLVISVPGISPPPPPAIVPDLAGRDEAQATALLRSAALRLGTVTRLSGTDRGAKVIAQTPAPGAPAERGSAVSVTLALLVPNVVGLSDDSAASLIAGSYLAMTTIGIDGADSLVGLVLRQAPVGGTPSKGGERVQLWVGSAPGLGVPLAVLAVLALTAVGLSLVSPPIPPPAPAASPPPPPPPAIGLHPHVGPGPRRPGAEPSRLERLDLQLTPHLGDNFRSVETHEDFAQERS